MRSALHLWILTAFGLGLVLVAGCDAPPPRRVFTFENAVPAADSHAVSRDAGQRGAGDIIESDPLLEGRSATRKITQRRTMDYYQPYREAFDFTSIGPYPNRSVGEVYGEDVWRSPFFLEKAEGETLPDGSQPLTFDIQSSHRRIPMSGGLIWLRARIGAPGFSNARSTGLNLALVVDLSESMKGEKLELLKATARSLVAQLLPSDTLAIVGYHDRAQAIVPASATDNLEPFYRAIEALQAGGGANVGAGLYEAYGQVSDASERGAGLGRVILLSDGHVAGGGWRTYDLARVRHRNNSMRLSTIAVGQDVAPEFLSALAQAGEGEFAMIDQRRDVDRILGKQLKAMLDNYALNVRLRISTANVQILDVYGKGIHFAGRGSRELILSNFSAGESRSILIRAKVPRLTAGNENLKFQLYSQQMYPVRRTTHEQKLTLEIGEEYGPADKTIETHAHLMLGMEYLKKAIGGGGELYMKRVMEMLDEHYPALEAVAKADGDPEVIDLADQFELFAVRIKGLSKGETASEDWAKLRREFYSVYR